MADTIVFSMNLLAFYYDVVLWLANLLTIYSVIGRE